MTKDEWIQKAKALFFDCTFCVDAGGIRKEINELLDEGGGYEPMNESSKTKLRWPHQKDDPDPKDTRELLFRFWMYLTAVDFEARNEEWDTLTARLQQKLRDWPSQGSEG